MLQNHIKSMHGDGSECNLCAGKTMTKEMARFCRLNHRQNGAHSNPALDASCSTEIKQERDTDNEDMLEIQVLP